MNARAFVLRLLPLRALNERRTVIALFALLFGALACGAALVRVTDPDVWWIAAAGRDTIARGAVPQTNGYAFTDASHPWVMHEWLYGVLLAPGADRIGPAFFALVGLACGTASASLAIAFVVKSARRLASAALALLVLAPIASALYGARPSFATLSLALAMMHVAFAPVFSRARGVAAVGIAWAWTQLHGSFPLGVAILIVGCVEHARDRRSRAARVAATIGAAFVTLVNPYGLRLHGLVERYVAGGDEVGKLIHSTIQEFQPLWRAGPVWASPPTIAALAIVAALAASALVRGRHRARAGFVLVLTAMALYQARHAALAIVLGATLLVVAIDDLLDATPVAAPAPAPATRRAWPLVLAIVTPGLVVGAALWTRAARSRSPEAWVHESLGGASAFRLARSLPDGAHVYAPFAPSAVILWLDAPRGVRVFYDPRNDCYSADVFRAADALESDVGADRTLVDRGTDAAIVPRASRLFAVLARSPAWERVSDDGEWALFAYPPRSTK